jgi:hypothetical protein
MLLKKIELAVSRKRTAALTAAAMLCPVAAGACSWPEGYKLTEASVIDRFCEADAVFVGEVESTLDVRDQITETKIWPRETLKGQIGSPAYALDARLKTGPGGDCGFRFQPKGRYLVFADRYEDTDYLCVSTCDLSQKFDPESLAYRVIQSTTNVEEECNEDSARKRQAEHRDELVRKFSEKDAEMEELYELTRQQQEASEAAASEL